MMLVHDHTIRERSGKIVGVAPGQQAGAAGQDLGDASRVPGDMQGDAETGARRHGHTQEGGWTLAKSGAMSILCDPPPPSWSLAEYFELAAATTLSAVTGIDRHRLPSSATKSSGGRLAADRRCDSSTPPISCLPRPYVQLCRPICLANVEPSTGQHMA